MAVTGIKLMGVPQPIPVHEFSSNSQDMITPRGSIADYFFGGLNALNIFQS